MHIFCSICKDIYFPSSEVYVTNCGHLYHGSCISTWIKQHRTCPQCRASLSQPFRIYFDAEKDEVTDRVTLEHQVENLMDQLRESEKCKKKLFEEKKNFEKIVVDMKECALSLTQKNDVLKTSVKALKEQVTKLTKQSEGVTRLEREVESWKAKVSTLERVETLIKGSAEEVNKMVESTPITGLAVKQLCTYVGILKHQLNKIETKNIMLAEENRDFSRALAEEKKKQYGESDELIRSLRARNRKLENDLHSLTVLFKYYKRKYYEKVKPAVPPYNNESQVPPKKNLLDINLDTLLEDENESTQLVYPVESDKAINHWEELVCAGPSKNFGFPMRNSGSFGSALYDKDDNGSSRLATSYAFNGLGGRKKVRLGGPTPTEELEKLKQKKDTKGVQTFQHKKIFEYYQMDCEN